MKISPASALLVLLGALAGAWPMAASAETTAPVITVQPTSLSVMVGGAATFTVVATGTPPLTYQWSKDNVAISAATLATLTLNAVAESDAGSYTVTVANSAGSTLSTAATLAVTPATKTAPTITTQPESKSVSAGASVTFSVTATGTGTLTYSWFKEGRLLSMGATSTFTIAAATTADAGTYRVTVSNDGGSTTSNDATLLVTGITPLPPPR